MPKLIDLTGQRFGRLAVLKRGENSNDGNAKWICNCDCGSKSITVYSRHLRSGHTKSCGCLKMEAPYNTTHKQTNTRIYKIWCGIKRRTSSAIRKDYKYYKGIDVCEDWANDFEVFYKWAIENGYSDNLTLDRIDNSKGYSPVNCRWATVKMQNNNKRSNCVINYKGVSKTLAEWAENINISYDVLLYRVKNGWSTEKAFTTPVRKGKGGSNR